MPGDPRVERLLDDLRRLAVQDARREVFGAQFHGYRLNRVLPIARIRALENRRSIQFPSEYVSFLTEMGNGGAGPFYGVHPLGERDADTGDGTRSWWSDDPLIGDLTRPFPHTDAWNLSEAEIARAREGEEDGPELDGYWRGVDGAIPVVDEGCALRDWLIIAGPERGHVWHDARADFGGFRPWTDGSRARLTFLEWYAAWLEAALTGRRFTAPA